MAHAHARLTAFGRLLLVQRILELGWPPAQAAESLGGVASHRLQVAWPLPSAWSVRPGRPQLAAAPLPPRPVGRPGP
jgi:hypothetical protein